VDPIRSNAQILSGLRRDFTPLLNRIGDARLVLLGEASHGTHEFYRARADITKRLIAEKGFSAVAVEADWPDASRVNTFVRGRGVDHNAEQALGSFERFPRWMWRNTDISDFVTWLHEFNRESQRPVVGFYGLDLYSLNRSIEAVLQYLDEVDPAVARLARERYSCFDHYGDGARQYAYSAAFGAGQPCEDEVVQQLTELQRRAGELAMRDGRVAEDEFFSAEQNARLIKNAERYYRSMFAGPVLTWNFRDQHMFETLESLLNHLGAGSKIVVWEHNSHLGDARATDMSIRGEHNVGQLVRMKYSDAAVLVGFTTYTGTVRAADEWNGPDRIKQVRPALWDSYELLFHQTRIQRFLLVFSDDPDLERSLSQPKLERAIGVIYRPEAERASHYFHARLARQFDAVIHFDETRAVVALGGPEERVPVTYEHEMPETYPSGV
jgi:erythromycin esterase-like protein